jgi:hypothetical protein
MLLKTDLTALTTRFSGRSVVTGKVVAAKRGLIEVTRRDPVLECDTLGDEIGGRIARCY